MGTAERWRRFRELPPDIEAALLRLVPLFESQGVLLAYVFGSLRKGGPAHDVDLAILTRERPAFELRAAITQALGTERVDLLDLRSASPLLRFEVVRTGRLLYARSAAIQEDFELDTLHLYRDTAPLRQRQREYLKRRMEYGSSVAKPRDIEGDRP
jgi:predicted nucleotidyltransferase